MIIRTLYFMQQKLYALLTHVLEGTVGASLGMRVMLIYEKEDKGLIER